jgi:hypothetical protein
VWWRVPVELRSYHSPQNDVSLSRFNMTLPEEEQQAVVDDATPSTAPSALADNIARKGKNAYYFAHAHGANGPQWDGKAEPRLLAKESSSDSSRQDAFRHGGKNASFDYAKSNITSYAFTDEPLKVKLYIEMEGVGTKCADDDVRLDYTERSLSLVVTNYKPDGLQCLSFSKLAGGISKAVAKKKENRIIVTLTKTEEGEWHTIHDKGEPDHEVL